MSKSQAEVQQMALLYQELNGQLEALEEQLSYVENAQMGLSITKTTIEKIRNSDPDEEIILPIGNSAYIKAKIVDPDNFLMSVARDVIVEKNAEEALQYSRKVEEEQRKTKNLVETRINEIKQRIAQITPQLQQYMNLQNQQ